MALSGSVSHPKNPNISASTPPFQMIRNHRAVTQIPELAIDGDVVARYLHCDIGWVVGCTRPITIVTRWTFDDLLLKSLQRRTSSFTGLSSRKVTLLKGRTPFFAQVER